MICCAAYATLSSDSGFSMFWVYRILQARRLKYLDIHTKIPFTTAMTDHRRDPIPLDITTISLCDTAGHTTTSDSERVSLTLSDMMAYASSTVRGQLGSTI